MRGIILTVLLIVTLIIGILVVKDMKTENQTGTKNIERIDQAKKAANQAQKDLNRIKDTAKQVGQTQPAE